jgi:hypothetical protein
MKYCLAILLLSGLIWVAPAHAEKDDVGEGFAKPTYIELVQTLVLMGGYDIKNPQIADEYARAVYCNLYRKNFNNDVAWNKIRTLLVSRAAEKKEYFRVLYETTGVFKLGRYDFESQAFPLASDINIKNVGSILLYSNKDPHVFCGNKMLDFFPVNVTLDLNRPLTIDRLSVPADKIEKMLVRIDEERRKSKDKDKGRVVYGRIRVQVSDAPGLASGEISSMRSRLRGDVRYVDFFIDKEMTKPIGGFQVGR